MKKTPILLIASNKNQEEYLDEINEIRSDFDVILESEQDRFHESDYIVLMGGDGSLNHLVNGHELQLVTSKKIIYFPTGTANDFARSLNIEPTTPSSRKLESIICGDKVIEVPVCICNEKYFVNVMVAGAAALVTESGDTLLKKVMGKVTYFIGAIEQLLRTSSYKYTFTAGKQSKSVESAGFLISQGLFAGGGVRVSPSFSANFGETFDFVSLSSERIGEILSSAIELQKEEPDVEQLDLDFIQTTKVEIRSDQVIPAKLDGEEYQAKNFLLEKSSKSLKFLLH